MKENDSEIIITQPYKNMGYTHEMELFFSEIGEDCQVISSLHMMCHKRYKNKETFFNTPIITITAFIGFISGLNLSYEYMHIILGSLSLFASLLKSYFSYLKISQKGENHRISYIQYGQIYSDIKVELALAHGKKGHDKRQALLEKQSERETQRALSRRSSGKNDW